jgi:hypothetical protein
MLKRQHQHREESASAMWYVGFSLSICRTQAGVNAPKDAGP